MKSPRVDAARVHALYQRRLAGLRIDRVDRDAVLSAVEDALALDFRGTVGTIHAVDKSAVRVHVDRARELSRSDVRRIGQRALLEERLGIDIVSLEPVHPQLILALQ